MSNKEKFKKLILDMGIDLHTVHSSYSTMIKDKNPIIYDLINMSKYVNILKDNDFNLNSRVVINAVVDLILVAHDILTYISVNEEDTCTDLVIEITHKILTSWKQILETVDNRLIIKMLIEKLAEAKYCHRAISKIILR